MPSTITHSYFILDVYDRLSSDRKFFLKGQINNLKVFSQSIDPLNYYFSFNIKKDKKIRGFSKYFHTHKCGEYLITLTNYIKYNYYKVNPEIMAYLYSMVSHYVLDSTIHPFVYYNTGLFKKNIKKTYKYNGLHHMLENDIDQFMIMLYEKKKPYKYKVHTEIFENYVFSKELIEVINFSFKETFGINNFYKNYKISIKKMKFIFKHFRYDKWNLKNRIYTFYDKITPSSTYKISFLSYHKKRSCQEFLNKKHGIWFNPTNKKIKSKKSFVDLYLEALFNTVHIIKELDKYIYENKKIDLNKLIKNKSYLTGIDLNKKQEIKFFKL